MKAQDKEEDDVLDTIGKVRKLYKKGRLKSALASAKRELELERCVLELELALTAKMKELHDAEGSARETLSL